MRPLVVIVPGSFIKTPSYIAPLTKIYCWYFGISLSPEHSLDNFQKYLERNDFAIKQFIWSGKVKSNLSHVAEQLISFLQKQSEYTKIILIGKSLGGNILEIASNQKNFPENVSKIVYIATPHPHKEVTKLHVKKYNVYSQADNYVSFAKKILYKNFSSNYVQNANNIILSHVRHSQFNYDIEINYKGKKMSLFELYKQIVTS